jgi:hypothetical protein
MGSNWALKWCDEGYALIWCNDRTILVQNLDWKMGLIRVGWQNFLKTDSVRVKKSPQARQNAGLAVWHNSCM